MMSCDKHYSFIVSVPFSYQWGHEFELKMQSFLGHLNYKKSVDATILTQFSSDVCSQIQRKLTL